MSLEVRRLRVLAQVAAAGSYSAAAVALGMTQ
jgi:DNA-binding transcriptional LysR family regulator